MSFKKDVFLGIDMGTSSVKAGLVSEAGRGLYSTSSAEYPTFYGKNGEVEQDPWDWWNAVVQAVQNLVKNVPDLTERIAAIAVSCQAPTLFGIDQDGNPVGRGLIWMDRRSDHVCRTILKKHEDFIQRYSCNRIDPYYMLSKLEWQHENDIKTYSMINCYLQINGWIVNRMTGGVRSIDITNANLTQLMNVHTLQWETEIFERLGLDISKMPEIVSTHKIVGKLTKLVAETLGLKEGIPVAAGCVDGAAAPYGLGLEEVGDVFEMSGTSSGIGVILSEPRYCPKLSLMKHVCENKWFLKGSTSCSGGSLKWYRDYIDERRDKECFEEYSMLAQKSASGANGVLFLPYLNGERAPLWNSHLKGVCLGFTGGTDKRDMIRAIMEGTAYALRTILEAFPEDVFQKDIILGTGGGYRSKIWSQIKSDVLEKKICVRQMNFDAAVLGDAYIAMEAIGNKRFEVPFEKMKKIYEPQRENLEVYEKQYRRFCRLYEVTKELFTEEG